MSSSKLINKTANTKKCNICSNIILKNQRFFQCEICDNNAHINCNKIDLKTYNKIKSGELPQSCYNCRCKNMAFQNITDTQFIALNSSLQIPNTADPNRTTKITCGICNKTIAKTHRNINCNKCHINVHINCNNTTVKNYNEIIKNGNPAFCINCHPIDQSTSIPQHVEKVTCGICIKTIAQNHIRIHCNACKAEVHIKCNKTDPKTYDIITKDNLQVICNKCQTESIPFQNLSDLELTAVSKGLNNDSEILEDLSITSTSLQSFFEEINKTNPFENFEDGDQDANATLINCKYYDLCSFTHKPKRNDFSLFHTNIGSLAKHKEELETVLSLIDFKFDIIALTETKLLKGKTPKFDINLPGYKCYHVDTEAEKGGSLLYISDHLTCKERPDLESLMYKAEVLESTFMEIINPSKKNILIGSIYRHPSMDLEVFNDEYLTPFLQNIDRENKKKFLLGDFNVDLLKIDNDKDSSTFFDTMTSNLFIPHIIHPTRITPTTKTLIDNIFSNSSEYMEGISGNFTLRLSDHLAQFLIIPENCQKSKVKTRDQFRRDFTNFDYENFTLDLLDIEWSQVIDLQSKDPNIAFADFHSKIDTLINNYLPLKKITKKELKLIQNPWITPEISKNIKQREKLHKNFIKTKDENLKELFHTRYKILRNQIVAQCKESKKQYFQNYFANNANDLRNTWRGIKSLIHLKNNKTTNFDALLINNKETTDPNEIANGFNNYFTNIAKNLQSTIHHPQKTFNDYLHNKSEKSFFVKPTTKFEIIDIINGNLNNKACGPNSIPCKIMVIIKDTIAEPLAEILNLSFTTGIYIDKLKISRVIPIYKEKGDKFLSENYRPISLLSNINKIYEKVMHNRLYSFLEEQGSIYENQFGFRKNHSTTHALIDLTENIRKAIDNNQFACGIFIDLQKAFDTVDHTILLKKLEHYGIRGVANDWFRSYLTNRKQYVSILGSESQPSIIEFGVPQGSVLGPLLFLLYINDLHKAIKYSKTRHFADDTNILIHNNSLKQVKKYLNLDLRQLCTWLKANKISLNRSKTELIIFRHPNKQINYDLKIKINGKHLQPTNSVKYLGIYLDPFLNWSVQTDSLSVKLSRATGMLSKIRHYVSKTTLRNIYYGIFSSLLTYASQVWGQFQNKNISRLQRIQNRAIRIINFAKYDHPPTPLYYNSRILKLSDHVKVENVVYVHNSLKECLPLPLKNTLDLIPDIQLPNTRGASLFKVSLPKVRTINYGIRSINYGAAAAWNTSFPKKILYDQSKSSCKRLLTNKLIDNYKFTNA